MEGETSEELAGVSLLIPAALTTPSRRSILRPMWSCCRKRLWLSLHLGLGLAWCALLASRAPTSSVLRLSAPQVFQILLLAGWLPTVALACWQVRHRRWIPLLVSDLLATIAMTGVACSLYVPLFFYNVVWFLPFALLPRGTMTELILRLFPVRRP